MKLFVRLFFSLCTVSLILSNSVFGGHLEKINADKTVRVCHWPAYYGISFVNSKSGKLEGIDIGLAHELANDLGVELQFVKTSFASFIEDIKKDKCDIAMFGVGITEERRKHLAFSDPYLTSDIYAITTKTNPTLKSWVDMDKKGHILVVQKGTYMEGAAVAFKNASILSVLDFQQREKEVRSGRADAFLTDFPYGKKILSTYDWAVLLESDEPFYEINYAYAMQQGDPQWLAYINAFVNQIKTDGRLKKHADENGLLPIAHLD